MTFSSGFHTGLAASIRGQARAGINQPASASERVIFLLDYDSFYARCMQQAYPPLRGKPIGISGPAKGTAVIAASTEAKQHGVKVGCHIIEARRRCPDFISVPADMDMYGEICTRSLRVLTSYTDRVEPFSIDEAFMDVSDLTQTFGDAHMLAQHIKQDLRAELGANITCSIGIAPNKMLAKLASGMNKPDGITHISSEEIPLFINKIALSDICGIGVRIERRMQRLGIYTVAQLGRIPREILIKEFGVLGNVYWLWGQGIDEAPVSAYHEQAEEKSMGHGLTLPEAVNSRSELNAIIQRLCERVGRRLRRRDMLAKSVTLWVRYDGFDDPGGFSGRHKFAHHCDESQRIYDAVQSLIPFSGMQQPVRQLNITVSELRHNVVQLSLLEDRVRERKLQKALDSVNDKYGEFSVIRGTILHDRAPLRNGPPGHGFCKRFNL